MKLKGIIVFHVDVGQLPMEKADAYLEKRKHEWNSVLQDMPDDWGKLFIPARSPTRIERIEF